MSAQASPPSQPSMQALDPQRETIRVDLQLIADMVAPGARVLDVGCGDGTLLDYLYRFKQVDGRGIELSMAGVQRAVSHGLSVIQGNADTDLRDYPSDAFDYVILSQTLQATQDPCGVLNHLLRIGRHAIVSFPNFGHWKSRLHLLFHGRMPVGEILPYDWWETPNIHLCTVKDFFVLCDRLEIDVVEGFTLDAKGAARPFRGESKTANLLAAQGVFLLRKRADQTG